MTELSDFYIAPEKVEQPWTTDQVIALERWQDCSYVHPFTCSHCRDGNKLIPTQRGWVCDTCKLYRQSWAWDFMFNDLPPDFFGDLPRS